MEISWQNHSSYCASVKLFKKMKNLKLQWAAKLKSLKTDQGSVQAESRQSGCWRSHQAGSWAGTPASVQI